MNEDHVEGREEKNTTQNTGVNMDGKGEGTLSRAENITKGGKTEEKELRKGKKYRTSKPN